MRRSLKNAGRRISGVGPQCYECHQALDLIWSDRRASLFYGCSNWPECDYTLPFRSYMVSDEDSLAAAQDKKQEAKEALSTTLKLGRKAAT